MAKTVLISGVAGFIGSAVADRLLNDGFTVYGIDNLNDYYSPQLKLDRVERVKNNPNAANFTFEEVDIADLDALKAVFEKTNPSLVFNPAAQASVRYDNAPVYVKNNLVGFVNLLECCRSQVEKGGFEHFLYASSSSVYGSNEKVPFEETDAVDHPKSLYAATKRANELMAYTYAHNYKLPSTGLRFFTVYGPWGRPDMSPIIFAKAIAEGTPIKVFNEGDLWRDFTFIDDIVEGVVRLLGHAPTSSASNGEAPTEVYNIGNSQPVKLLDFITTMEKAMGKKAILDMQPWPPTEVYKTYADTTKLANAVGYKPNTDLAAGLGEFAEWFKEYYGIEAEKLTA